MKRLLSILLIILLVIGLFSACSQPQNTDPTDSESETKISDTQNNSTENSTDKSTEENGGANENNGNGDGDDINPEPNPEPEPDDLYVREGNYIYFGEYPQSLKESSVTVSDTTDSRGYFLGSDGCYYAKIVASPFESGYEFSNGTALTSGATYYFKVEPIKWRILSESDGMALLLCESIIDGKRYDDSINDYQASEIRAWLNDSFLNPAFSDMEKALLQAVTLDNSAISTGYTENKNACDSTTDKVFLLSYADVINSEYGFSDDAFATDTRAKKTSDFARASGAWMTTTVLNEHYGNGLWMLRSPSDDAQTFIRECFYNGEVTDGGTNVTSEFFGVVPAIKIKL